MLNEVGITSRLNGLVKDRRRQAGQSSVFVLIFLPIVILSLVFLYKAGKVTSEKMELQNAADAVAYSVALLEARDLNFMAYSNRAMVVNEVALGQAVGLASLPRHWRSIGHYIEFLCGARIEPIAKLMVFPPPLKVVGQAIETTCKTAIRKVVAQLIFIKPGKFLTDTIMDPFVVKPLATVMHLSNEVLSGAQTLYHFGTIAYVVSAIDKINEDNADDARLSPYGLVALLGHLQTFGSLGAITGNPQGKFVRTYTPTKAGDTEGFARFAAVVNHSRDEFTKERGWEFKPLDISLTPGFAFSVNLFVVDFSIALDLDFGISLGISRLGGSELRYVGNKTQGDKFNWSSADTTASD